MMTKMADYSIFRSGSGTISNNSLNQQSLNHKDLSKRKSGQLKRASIQTFFNNRKRAKRIASAPTLSDADQQLAINKFLSEGKGKRYPIGATGNPMFKDDAICNKWLEQVTPIEFKDE